MMINTKHEIRRIIEKDNHDKIKLKIRSRKYNLQIKYSTLTFRTKNR